MELPDQWSPSINNTLVCMENVKKKNDKYIFISSRNQPLSMFM